MERKIILLADDDSDDTEMFCEALADIDDSILCHCTVNGIDALKTLDTLPEKPHLIFLDLNMPVMNGWQCLKVLKENDKYKNIPVIMISTSSHKREINIAMDLGALCYFVKPNSFEELTHVLHSILTNLDTGLDEAVLDLRANGYGHILSCADTK